MNIRLILYIFIILLSIYILFYIIHNSNKNYKYDVEIKIIKSVEYSTIIRHIQNDTNSEELINYKFYNPSICKINNKPIYSLRFCNFTLCNNINSLNNYSYFSLKPYQINSYVYLFIDNNSEASGGLNNNIEASGGLNNKLYYVDLTTNNKYYPNGYEDARLIVYKNSLYIIANKYFEDNTKDNTEHNKNLSICLIKLLEISSLNNIYSGGLNNSEDSEDNNLLNQSFIKPIENIKLECPITDNFKCKKIEKNWISIVHQDSLYFIHTLSPFVLLKYNDDSKKVEFSYKEENNIPFSLRGGTKVIDYTYMDKNYKICIAHFRYGNYYTNVLCILNYEYPFSLKYVSKEFIFSKNNIVFINPFIIKYINIEQNIQFTSGLEIFYTSDKNDQGYIYITYGQNDCIPKECKIDFNKFNKILSNILIEGD